MRRALVLVAVLASRFAQADDADQPEVPPGVPTETLAAPEPGKPVDGKPSNVDPNQPAQPPQPAPPKPTPSDEPTARDADGAPLPGHETGRTDQEAGDSLLRSIGQGVLTVPKVVLVTALQPVRVGLWAYDRYNFGDRFNGAFFDDTSTYGLYPTLKVDSSYGINIGARIIHRNLFGGHEKFSIRGSTGGQFRTVLDGRLNSGTRLGERVKLEARGEYERRPRDPFYGIGNDNPGIQTRFRTELKRATAFLDIKAADRVVIRGTGALTDRVYSPSSPSEGLPIDQEFDTTTLTGFTGVQNVYTELEVRWDQRGREATPGRHEIYDTGYLLSAFTGRVHQMDSGAVAEDYWRYGGEAQYFLGLGVGPRVLMTRVHVESVTGDTNDVVFNQLPALGGSQLLRGYAPDRYRDRAAVVGTAEYFWGLGQLFMASVFVDGGRVYSSLNDVSAHDLRVGYGGSLQLHGDRQYIAGVTMSSSIDGGFFINLTFDPVFDYDPRGERR